MLMAKQTTQALEMGGAMLKAQGGVLVFTPIPNQIFGGHFA